jgi:amidophosphoribosyltransferase
MAAPNHNFQFSHISRFKHIYGVDLAEESKLIAYGRSNLQVRKSLGCDGVFFLPLEDLINSCISARCHGDISAFEVGVFNGVYTTKCSYRQE